MQILNISVLNRPAKSITSRPYSVYDIDTVNFDVDSLKATQDNIVFKEVTSYGYGIMDGYIRDTLVKYAYKSTVDYGYAISDVRLTRDVVYSEYQMGRETVDYGYGVSDVRLTREVKYLKLRIDSEYTDYDYSIEAVKLI